jgi:hypothetical protein
MDPRSGIQKIPIPNPGSRGQKGTGSRIGNVDIFSRKFQNTVQNIGNVDTYDAVDKNRTM